jgi:ribonucrease Y
LLDALLSVGVGIFLGRMFFKSSFKKVETDAQERAGEIVKNAEKEAENIKRDRILEAKEKYLRLKTEFEEDSNRKKNLIIANEQKIKQREQQLNQMQEQNKRRETELETQKNTLNQQTDAAVRRREEADKRHAEAEKRQTEADRMLATQVEQLEKIAGLTAEQAREQIINTLKADAQTQAQSHIKNIIDEAKLTATKEAKKIVIETIQRTATEHAIENCVSVFNIESDDVS